LVCVLTAAARNLGRGHLDAWEELDEGEGGVPEAGACGSRVRLELRYGKAIWHMLTKNQPFAPAGAGFFGPLDASLPGSFRCCRPVTPTGSAEGSSGVAVR
jgi:hypothetical protein